MANRMRIDPLKIDPGPEFQLQKSELIAQLHDSLLDHAAHSKLTEREVEVVTLLLLDMSIEDIADALGIEPLQASRIFDDAVLKMRYTLLAELHAAQMCPQTAKAQIPNFLELPEIAARVGMKPMCQPRRYH